jgi:hypothetical protein
MYEPLNDHKTLTIMACPECERCKLMMQLAEADEDFAKRAEWQTKLDVHLAAEHAVEAELHR